MDAIVAAAGEALVDAMASDEWSDSKAALMALWRRTYPDEAPTIDRALDSLRAHVLAARDRHDPESERLLTETWKQRLQGFYDGGAWAAVELRRLVEEQLAPAMPADLVPPYSEYMSAADSASVQSTVLRTLPRDVPVFTGREEELRSVVDSADVRNALPIIAVDGMPGVGKTALVTRAAHLLAGHFADGQLFVRLHAHTPGERPADPADALGDLLVATGMAPHQLPAGLEMRMWLWRDRLAGKRILIVLDDVVDPAQVEPLLPGTPGCLVLITSRTRLVAFDGAVPLSLGTLPVHHSCNLFARHSHRELSDEEMVTVQTLVESCGNLPLAIAVLAGRLAHLPAWSITEFAEAFAGAQDRLSALAVGDRAVAAAFDMSYRELPEHRQRVFRRLGLHPGSELDAWAVAALADISIEDAAETLDALYTDHLIDEPIRGRYRMHDLVWDYSRSLAEDEAASVNDAAVRRLLDFFQHSAEAADEHLTRLRHPGTSDAQPPVERVRDFRDQHDALAWMRLEQGNLLACADHALSAGLDDRVMRLSTALAAFLRVEGIPTEVASLHHNAATIARERGDALAEANARVALATMRYRTADHRSDLWHARRALELYRELDDELGEANALYALGRTRRLAGDYRVAREHADAALRLHRRLGDRLGEAIDLVESGRVCRLTGDYATAIRHLTQGLAIRTDFDNRQEAANALWDLGRVYSLTGDLAEATHVLEEALKIHRELADRSGEANDLKHLGRVHLLQGRNAGAVACTSRALEIHRDLGNSQGVANCQANLAVVYMATEDLELATQMLEEALEEHRSLGDRLGEANDLKHLGRVHHMLGDHGESSRLLELALSRHGDLADPLGEAQTLHDLAALQKDVAGPMAALRMYRQAADISRGISHPLTEARALEGLASCEAAAGRKQEALETLRSALMLYERLGAAEVESVAARLTYWSTPPPAA